jgi:hypothetical protein
MLIVLIILVGMIYTSLPKEAFSTVFPLQTDVRLSGHVRESCKGVTRQKLIDYFGSERVLRNILLSYKIPKDIPITDKTAPAIANLISGGDTNNLC